MKTPLGRTVKGLRKIKKEDNPKNAKICGDITDNFDEISNEPRSRFQIGRFPILDKVENEENTGENTENQKKKIGSATKLEAGPERTEGLASIRSLRIDLGNRIREKNSSTNISGETVEMKQIKEEADEDDESQSHQRVDDAQNDEQ